MGEMPSPNVGGSLSVFQVLNMDYGVSVLGGSPNGYDFVGYSYLEMTN